MIRAVLSLLLPFLVPFVVYWLWVRLHRARQARLGLDPAAPMTVPTFWLAGAGAILAIMVTLLMWLFAEDTTPPGSHYVPPRMENGELVPGHFEAEPGSKARPPANPRGADPW